MKKLNRQQKIPVSNVKQFLWYCAGANLEILCREDCQTDRNKQAAIGKMVLLTACTSSLSASYALFTVFASPPIAVALGCFWGLTIFNLDRFFIISAKKSIVTFLDN